MLLLMMRQGHQLSVRLLHRVYALHIMTFVTPPVLQYSPNRLGQLVLSRLPDAPKSDPSKVYLPPTPHRRDQSYLVFHAVCNQVSLCVCIVNTVNDKIGVSPQKGVGSVLVEEALDYLDFAGGNDVGNVLSNYLYFRESNVFALGVGVSI